MRAFVRSFQIPAGKRTFPKLSAILQSVLVLLQFARAAAKTTLAAERFLSVNHSPLSSGTFARVCLLVEHTEGEPLAGDDTLKKLTDRVSSGRPCCIAHGSRVSHGATRTRYICLCTGWKEKFLEIQGQKIFSFSHCTL